MSTSERKTKKCRDKSCAANILEAHDVCPQCGQCQSKRCEEADAELRVLLENQPQKPPKIRKIGAKFPLTPPQG